jgi:hypothetical protein
VKSHKRSNIFTSFSLLTPRNPRQSLRSEHKVKKYDRHEGRPKTTKRAAAVRFVFVSFPGFVVEYHVSWRPYVLAPLRFKSVRPDWRLAFGRKDRENPLEFETTFEFA